MSDRKKILFLSSWYPTRNAPTHGIFVKRHAEACALHNQVAVLYVCSDQSMKDRAIDLTVVEDGPVYTVIVYYKKVTTAIPLVSSWTKLYRYKLAYYKGWKHIRKNFGIPDLVHANILFPSGSTALVLKMLYGIPYIVTENWTGYLPSDGSYRGFFRKFITKRIANSAGFLTPVSLDLQQAMQSHGFRSNYEIVPNVVDVKLFYPEENKIRREKKRIIHVSALEDPQKNVSGIIRTISKIAKGRADVELYIVGDGEYRTKLEQLAQQLDVLNRSVFFTGLKLKDDLASFMRQSDFFVLFSNYENLPCVALESLASGIPVIVTKIGGTPEHISKEMGIIVEPKDEAALEKAIHHMLDHHSEYKGEQLREYAVKKFSYESVAEQFDGIYDKVLRS